MNYPFTPQQNQQPSSGGGPTFPQQKPQFDQPFWLREDYETPNDRSRSDGRYTGGGLGGLSGDPFLNSPGMPPPASDFRSTFSNSQDGGGGQGNSGGGGGSGRIEIHHLPTKSGGSQPQAAANATQPQWSTTPTTSTAAAATSLGGVAAAASGGGGAAITSAVLEKAKRDLQSDVGASSTTHAFATATTAAGHGTSSQWKTYAMWTILGVSAAYIGVRLYQRRQQQLQTKASNRTADDVADAAGNFKVVLTAATLTEGDGGGGALLPHDGVKPQQQSEEWDGGEEPQGLLAQSPLYAMTSTEHDFVLLTATQQQQLQQQAIGIEQPTTTSAQQWVKVDEDQHCPPSNPNPSSKLRPSTTTSATTGTTSSSQQQWQDVDHEDSLDNDTQEAATFDSDGDDDDALTSPEDSDLLGRVGRHNTDEGTTQQQWILAGDDVDVEEVETDQDRHRQEEPCRFSTSSYDSTASSDGGGSLCPSVNASDPPLVDTKKASEEAQPASTSGFLLGGWKTIFGSK